MTIIEQQLRSIEEAKFSFGKRYQFLSRFSKAINAFSMFDLGFGLGIPQKLSPENQLRGIFLEVLNRSGYFVFNINGVNLERARQGFDDYFEAESDGMITEWELSMIIAENTYLERTIFHNQVVELPKTKNGIQFLWKQ